MTISEHRLAIFHQLEELSEDSLIELEKIIATLKANQVTGKLKKRRQPPASIAGKAKIVGDLTAPCINIEKIYHNVQTLPESSALEVLHFAEFLAVKNQELDKKIQKGIEQANKGLGVVLDDDYIDDLNARVAKRLAEKSEG